MVVPFTETGKIAGRTFLGELVLIWKVKYDRPRKQSRGNV